MIVAFPSHTYFTLCPARIAVRAALILRQRTDHFVGFVLRGMARFKKKNLEGRKEFSFYYFYYMGQLMRVWYLSHNAQSHVLNSYAQLSSV